MAKKPNAWECTNCGTVNPMAEGQCTNCASSYKLTMDKKNYDPDSREDYNKDHMQSLKVKALGACVAILGLALICVVYYFTKK